MGKFLLPRAVECFLIAAGILIAIITVAETLSSKPQFTSGFDTWRLRSSLEQLAR